jgi:hypothetical protein
MELETITKQAYGWDLNKLSIANNSLSPNGFKEEIHVIKNLTLQPRFPRKSLILVENCFELSPELSILFTALYP